MKVKILSDLHMEGQKFEYQYGGEDLIILAGDIHTRDRHEELLKQIPRDLKVVCILGNHELYHGSRLGCEIYFEQLGDIYPNFIFLDNTWKIIEDVAIFGGMMCTDFTYDNLWGLGVSVAKEFINDFRFNWRVEDHIEEFGCFEKNLQGYLRVTEGMKRIVISHFLPHPIAIAPQFQNSSLNSYFCRDMTEYMGWEGLWVYGHTHSAADFLEGATRLISNPRGYRGETPRPYDQQVIVEI